MSQSAVIPSLRYKDAPAAIAWLEGVLGFTRHAVYEGPDDTIAHAELRYEGGMIMLGSVANASPMAKYLAQPAEIQGRSSAPLYLVVADARVLHARAEAAGASIVQALHEASYGGWGFSCLDPEQHLWSIGEYDPWANKN